MLYVRYTYNHLNKPITNNINGKIAIYEYDLEGNLVLESNEYGLNGSVLVRIVWYNGEHIIRYSYGW